MGSVVGFRKDGQVVRHQPPDTLALECGCDWGGCNKQGAAWRWSELAQAWLVCCAGCLGKPTHMERKRR
jgi:hypothetical protein